MRLLWRAADAVFTLQPTDRGRGQAFMAGSAGGGKPVIGVSVREWEAVSPRTLAKALDDLVAATGAVFVHPMQYPADYEFSRLVASHMFQPGAGDEPAAGHQDLLDLCSGLDMMGGNAVAFLDLCRPRFSGAGWHQL